MAKPRSIDGAPLPRDRWVRSLEVLAAMSHMIKPFPTELPAPINPEAGLNGKAGGVENHRNLFCAHYDDCLDEAVKRGWNSFSCSRCPLFQQPGEYEGGVEGFATQRRWA